MPQEEKKHISTTTGILIILAAAVIIGGGAIAYFYAASPTSWDYMGKTTVVHKGSNANTNTSNTNSTATADWKTYTNTDYGFSIEYPKEWPVEASKISDEILLAANFMPTWLSDTDSPFSIMVYKRPLQTVIDGAVKSFSFEPSYIKTTTTFKGLPATQITYAPTNGSTYKYIYFEKNGYTFVLSGVVKDGVKKDGKDLGQFEKISQTFQFTQ